MTRPVLLFFLSGFFLVAGFLAPNHYSPWTGFYSEMPAAVALLVVAAYALTLESKLFEGLPRYVIFLALVPTLPLIQWGYDEIHFAGDAIVAFLYLVGAVSAYACGHLLSRSPGLSGQNHSWG